jgi:filamentous hemagglutinin
MHLLYHTLGCVPRIIFLSNIITLHTGQFSQLAGNGWDFNAINMRSAWSAFGAGAITGAMAGATFGASLLGSVALAAVTSGALISGMGYASYNVFNGSRGTLGGLGSSMLTGGVMSGAMYGVSNFGMNRPTATVDMQQTSKAIHQDNNTYSSGANNVVQFERLRAGYAANEIFSASRTGTALIHADPSHRAASFLTQQQLAAGRAFTFRGGDGIYRVLLQTKGGLNGNVGIFEYILTPNGFVSHQRFIIGGQYTGFPNQ